ncbi:site-specific integrase [Hymenobacter sp. BT188]|uniref:tyrosine-type recombinase/integrase n=1 Tax=Hymenobacter sp. BT188 TaxID=2763504 RepID=UPI00165108B3|nr:site-specific integrase [Hymenobacter sp. BT188]MBC6608899.1 site-specific integrase [Hymenobacter sp. BT188]
MGVKLRKRKLRDGSEQYYFDVYYKGRREYPTYKEPQLIIRPGKDKATLKANADVERQAERVLSILEGRLAEGTYVFQTELSATKPEERDSQSFLSYFRAEAERRRARRGCKSNTYSCFRHFERFMHTSHREDLGFQQFTTQFVEEFRAYLTKLVVLNESRKSGLNLETNGNRNRGINSNCAQIYFKRLKMVSAMAFKEGLISKDAAFPVKNFASVMPQRHYLDPEEVKKLVQELKANPVDGMMKRAFLFACATGLRWADLTALTWKDIQGDMLDTEIRKSKGKKRLRFALSAFALSLVGETKQASERIFPLTYNMYLNVKLDRWILSTGINKKITWHCARHTFATCLLFKNEDISLVQKALAHSRIDTTQIYAKILDSKLNKATSSIGDLFV